MSAPTTVREHIVPCLATNGLHTCAEPANHEPEDHVCFDQRVCGQRWPASETSAHRGGKVRGGPMGTAPRPSEW